MISKFLQDLNKVQSLVSAFEFDLKQILRSRVISTNPGALSHLQEDLSWRRRKERNLDDDVDHLHLGECIEILAKSSSSQPELIREDIEVLAKEIEILTEIRNRAFHIKLLDENDFEFIVDISEKLESVNWPHFYAQIKEVTSGDLSFLEKEIPKNNLEVILNNLQPPDYSETTLIGRKAEVEEILEKIRKGRLPYIQIVGPAGTGKSALATQVLYKVIERGGLGFDCVLWVSLKFEKLTLSGINEIRDSITELFPAIEGLGKVFDSKFNGAVSDLGEMIDSLDAKILLCIDNMESTTGEDFGLLYESLPASVTYLLTSRFAIAPTPYHLKPLSPASSKHLLIKLGKILDIEYINSASIKTLDTLVEKFGNPTLYLKLLCLGLQAGRTLHDIETNLRSDFLSFAVSSAIESISATSNFVLATICGAKSSISFTELIHATDLEIDILNEALRELNSKSLIASRGDAENQMWIAQDLVIEYVNRWNPFPADIQRQVKQGLNRVQDDAERARRDRTVAPLNPYSPSADNIANPSLREAIRAYEQKNRILARNYIAAARQQSPDYYEIDRFEAWLLRDQDIESSHALYSKAYIAAPDEVSKAVVGYHFGLSLLSWNRVQDSIHYLKESLKSFNDFSVHHQLALAYCRNLDFERALESIEHMKEIENGRQPLLRMTTEVSAYRRWAEHLLESGYLREAWEKLIECLVRIDDAINNSTVDREFQADSRKVFYVLLPLLEQVRISMDLALCSDVKSGLITFRDLTKALANGSKMDLRDSIVAATVKSINEKSFFSDQLASFNLPELTRNMSLSWRSGVFLAQKPDSAGGYGFLENAIGERIYFRVDSIRPKGRLATNDDIGKKVYYLEARKEGHASEVWFE